MKGLLICCNFLYNQIKNLLLDPQLSPPNTYLLIYVDDSLITCNTPGIVHQLIKQSGREFALKDLGKLSYFFGIKAVHYSKGLILLHQRYLLDILRRINEGAHFLL